MPNANAIEERCRPGDKLARGEYVLENNCWGSAGVSHFTQCISASPNGNQLGWTWDYSGEEPDRVKAYPEVIFGKKPFTPGASTTAKLPCAISPVPTLTIDYTSRTIANGRYNAAFEIWLTNSPAATQASITHEVMFWVGQGGRPSPAGNFSRTLQLADGRTADLWIGPMQSWKYLAFVFRQPVPSGTIAFGDYLRDLLQHGNIPVDAYIADLEFGNEVWHGSGSTVLDRYVVTM